MIRPRKPTAVTKIRDARIDALARQSDIALAPEREKVLAEVERIAWRVVQITARNLKARIASIDFAKLQRADVDLPLASDVHLASEALAKWRAVRSLR